MKIVFVGGPYRGDGSEKAIEENIARSQDFQKALAYAGVPAYSPNVHDTHWEKLETGLAQATLKRVTGYFLHEVAAALVVMPGWDTSIGTKEEIAIAQNRKIPIFYPQSPEDLQDIITWYKGK